MLAGFYNIDYYRVATLWKFAKDLLHLYRTDNKVGRNYIYGRTPGNIGKDWFIVHLKNPNFNII